jgi:hypothetical protein
MTKLYSLVVVTAFCGIANAGIPKPTVTANCTILSGVQDASNIWQASTNFGFKISNQSGTGIYLNQISLSSATTIQGSGTFDPTANLTLNLANITDQGYSLGTMMNTGASFEFNNLFLHNGAFDAASAPVGIYSFNAIFKGGTSATDTKSVVSVGIKLEIINRLDAYATMTVNPDSILPGETATAYATLHNNMTDRNFVTSTWGIDDTGGMDYGWAGNWFNKTITPGGTLTDAHSTWTVPEGSASGTYRATTLVVGGLYNGDNYWFGSNGNTVVNVKSVPEPLTLLTLGAGFAVLAARRRRRSK